MINGSLPDNCLLRAVLPTPEMSFDETPIVRSRPTIVQSGRDAEEKHRPERAEFLIAPDHDRKWVVIEGYAPITGRKMVQLMVALIELYCQDREEGRKPETYRTKMASELADLLDLSDVEAVRKTVSRIREDITAGRTTFGAPARASGGLVENVHGKGYRINPRTVRVVALSEIQTG